MRCPSCDRGELVPEAVEGRRWSYRNLPDIELPADLVIPTCSECGESVIDRALAGVLDRVLAPEYERQLREKAESALELLAQTGIRQRDLEPLLGLSAGYLSKVKKGKDSSAQLVATLMLLAVDPTLIERLRRLWSTQADLAAERAETICQMTWSLSTPAAATTEFVPPPEPTEQPALERVVELFPSRIAA